MGLCEQCQSMTTTPLAHGRNSLYRHDHISLQKAVFESRCFICSRVWDSLSEEQKAVARGPAFEGIAYRIYLSKIPQEDDEEQSEVLATLSFDHGDDLYDVEDYNEVGGLAVGSMGCFAILNPSVSKWIDDCYSNHETCRSSRQSQWKPTRLVDISQSHKGYMRVVETSTLPEEELDELYIALSHCWGRKAFLVMEEHNREEFEKGVFVSSLAPNFQDAIAITRQLGYRYIWIDSLCIIQGSREDWGREAPMMNKVYRNAVITLGAMASPHGYGGLFRSRDPEMTEPCPFRLRTEDAGDIECLLVNSDFWETQVRQAPLSQRAWVVQERILAPRSLYFCESQLFWECRQHHACEVFPDGIPLEFMADIKEPDAVDVVSVKAFETTLARFSGAGSDSHDDPAEDEGPWVPRQYESPYEVWDDIMEAYAKCALTNPADKLVAISGIVKDFAGAIGDDYVAGLWRNNLINGLLWMAKDQSNPDASPATVVPDKYRAPTWSWASIDAHDTKAQACERDLYGEYVEVLGVRVEPRADDPTAELKHACLHLRGHLIKTRHKPKFRGGAWGFGTFIADKEEFESEEFFCLPLREQMIGGRPFLRGLVLAPCPEEDEDSEHSHGEEDEEIRSLCGECLGKDLYVRVGTFDSEKGDPLKYLGMQKPTDWEDWGEESDHLWFSRDTPMSEFVII